MSNSASVMVVALVALVAVASVWYGLKLAKWLSSLGGRWLDRKFRRES